MQLIVFWQKGVGRDINHSYVQIMKTEDYRINVETFSCLMWMYTSHLPDNNWPFKYEAQTALFKELVRTAH